MKRQPSKSSLNYQALQRAQQRANGPRKKAKKSVLGPALSVAGIVVVALLGIGIFGGGDAGSDSAAQADSSLNDAAVVTPVETQKPAPEEIPKREEPVASPAEDEPDEEKSKKDAADQAEDETITALTLLDTIPVKGRAPKTGYARNDMFGKAWIDVDRNGCDNRNDVLQRDLTDIALQGSCKVMSGTLVDPFTAETISFVRGNDTSFLVQIDHVVALSDAWQKGAQQLTQDQRVTLANDPINLLAVDGPANQQKSDADAASWLPSNKEFRCDYIARQVSVKAAYGLWVTKAEGEAMRRVLDKCPEQPAYFSALATQVMGEGETPSGATATTDKQPGLLAVTKPNSSTSEPARIADTAGSGKAPAKKTATKAPTKAPTQAPAPAPAPVPEPAPAPAPAPAPVADNTYYKNCTAARAAGAAPVYSGQAGYGRHLDRDGDGVGCE